MRYLSGAVLVLSLLAAPAWAVFVDNFDSYTNGNLSMQGGWDRGNGGTSWIQVVDNPNGGKMVKIVGGTSGGDRTVGNDDPAIVGQTGTIWVEFDILKSVGGNTSWSVLATTNDAADGNLARAYGTPELVRGRIGDQGIVTGQDPLAAGWNHIKVVIDTAANTDTFYMNGVLLTGTNPISHAGFAGDVLQRISFHKVDNGQDVYLDNLSVTPEPASLLLLSLGGLLLRRRRA